MRGARAIRCFVWLAALTPALAHSLPFVHQGATGVSFPWFAALGGEDLFWLALVAADVSWLQLRRARASARSPGRGRVRFAAAGVLAAPAAWLLLALAAALSRPDAAAFDLRDRPLAAGEWVIPTPIGFSPHESDYALLSAPGAPLPLPPSARHWLGSDAQGRDLLARLLFGLRVSLGIGAAATAIALAIGVTYGLLCGVLRGATDLILMRVVEVMLCFPHFFLVLIVFAYLPHSRTTLTLLLGLVGWTTIARLTRGELLRLGGEEFVQAARALGASPLRLALRHFLPNALAPILAATTFAVSGAMLSEFGLSWLGFGVAPPTPSLGQILADGQPLIARAPWIALAPGFLIFAVVLSFNALGESLRVATTPERRSAGPAPKPSPVPTQ